MKYITRMLIILLVAFSCAGCDQGTKSLAGSRLPKNEMISYFYDTVRLGYTENTGAFLGLGGGWPKHLRIGVFSVLTGVFLASLFLYLACRLTLNILAVTGFSLILGGGFSNLYDRIVNEGAVVDFLNIGLGSFRTGIFNVADVAIMLGGMIVVLTYSRTGIST